MQFPKTNIHGFKFTSQQSLEMLKEETVVYYRKGFFTLVSKLNWKKLSFLTSPSSKRWMANLVLCILESSTGAVFPFFWWSSLTVYETHVLYFSMTIVTNAPLKLFKAYDNLVPHHHSSYSLFLEILCMLDFCFLFCVPLKLSCVPSLFSESLSAII